MEELRSALICLVIAAILNNEITGSTLCKNTGKCKALCNGTVLDLATILDDLPLQIFDSNGRNKSEESLFFIAPCEGYACGNEGPETAVCQEKRLGFYSCGLLNETVWRLESTDPYRYTVTFTGGVEERASTLKFIENVSVNTINATYTGEYPQRQYNFKVVGKCIRPGSCYQSNKDDYTGIIGFVFISLFVTGVILYLTIGACVMYIRGAKGQELIPNIEFWKDLPQLVKDGCLFTVAPCCHRFQTSSYAELSSNTS